MDAGMNWLNLLAQIKVYEYIAMGILIAVLIILLAVAEVLDKLERRKRNEHSCRHSNR